MNTISKRKAIFKLNRNQVGNYVIDIRKRKIFTHCWIPIMIVPMHFTECLIFIKEWCCNNNIGIAIILDPDGVNKEMVINYRRYKDEVLNELKQ